MNLTRKSELSRLGENQGLNIGLDKLNTALSGLNKSSYIAVAGSNKAGKTTLVNQQFIIDVYLNNPDKNIKWIYYSYEMNRIQMGYKFASYFLFKDYGERLSTNYLMGKAKDDNKKPILISDKHLKQLEAVEKKYIIPLFGEYDEKDNLVKEGKILFFDKKDEPDNIKKYLEQLALQNGRLLHETYQEKIGGVLVNKKKISGYVPNQDSPHFIVILDHIRKLKRPQGLSEKDTMDLMSTYFADIAREYMFTCIALVHLNRDIGDLDLIKFLKDAIFPNEDFIKQSSNIGEDCTELITVFNAADPKMKLKSHFGLSLENFHNNYRSIHLVLSRYSECPIHVQTEFDGLVGSFTQL